MKRTSGQRTYLEEKLQNKKFRAAFVKELVYASISEQLAKKRAAAKMTQDQVATKMHTKKSVISRLESGTYKGFSITTLCKYASAVNAEVRFELVTPRKKKRNTSRLQVA